VSVAVDLHLDALKLADAASVLGFGDKRLKPAVSLRRPAAKLPDFRATGLYRLAS